MSGEHYLEFYQNLFLWFKNMKFESQYYISLYYLISGLVPNSQYSIHEKWDLFNSYSTNMELIPYDSRGISIPKNLFTFQI
jgi:hypothetical protein